MDNKIIKPIISVLMPVYNGEKYLRDAIDSILNQTFTDYEFLIINDGSNDLTDNIITSYKDARIKYIINYQNLGLIKSLNKGIRLAEGEFIARMDADDISLPSRFEKQLRLFSKYPSIDIVSVFPKIISSTGKVLCNSSYFTCTKFNACRFVALFDPPILHPGVIIRTNSLKEYKYDFNQKNLHIEAYDLWTRMLFNNVKCEILPEFLLEYRDNDESICHKYSEIQLYNHLNSSKNIIKKELKTIIDEDAHRVIIKRVELINQHALINSLSLIDSLKYKYFIKYQNLSYLEKKEIHCWCKQRKFVIIMNCLLNGSRVIKKTAFNLLIKKIYYIFDYKIVIYIYNRFCRILNTWLLYKK